MTPESQGDKDRPSEERPGPAQAHLALVQQMAEPLTALGSYLDAAARLLRPDTLASRKRLVEIIEKSQAQVARAREVLRRMRDLQLEKK